MIKFEFKVNQQDLEDVLDMDRDMMQGLEEGMGRAMALVQKAVKGIYLSGKALKQRSGKLKRSIGTQTTKTANEVIGSIGTLKYPVDYGPVWEFGGEYPATVIDTIKAKALHFFTKKGGAEVFAKSARIPAHPIKAKPYIMPAIEDNLKRIFSILGEDATKEMNK